MSYKQIDPRFLCRKDRYLGEKFTNFDHLAGEKKCDYCGKWFSWSTQNIDKYIVERRWDFNRKEAIHCGSGHCWDYHMRVLKHEHKLKTSAEYRESNFVERKKREGMDSEKAFALYQRMKASKVVA
jgi:hypothetical protein